MNIGQQILSIVSCLYVLVLEIFGISLGTVVRPAGAAPVRVGGCESDPRIEGAGLGCGCQIAHVDTGGAGTNSRWCDSLWVHRFLLSACGEKLNIIIIFMIFRGYGHTPTMNMSSPACGYLSRLKIYKGHSM